MRTGIMEPQLALSPEPGDTAVDRELWQDVTVVIPCYNEAETIGKVVADFSRALPGARLIVVDNASSDETASVARNAGAHVVAETRRGKGFALLHGFRAAR